MYRQFSLILLGLFVVVSLASVGYGDTSLSDSYDFSSFLMGSEKQPAMPTASEMVTEVGPPYGCPVNGCGEVCSEEVCSEGMCCDEACCGEMCCDEGFYGECGCGSMCCGSACPCLGCSCYRWRAYAGALFWSRTSPGGGLVNGGSNPNDYEFGWSNGWETGLGRRLNCCWGVEGRFYRIDSFDAEYNGSSYSSELTNFELNLRRAATRRMDLVFGFRYMQLNDQWVYGQLQNHAFNNMYGFHLGPDICLFSRGNFCVDWGSRFGIYGNRIQNVAMEQDHTSFSADMTLAGTYQYRDSIAVRFGYQLLWLEGVAEATAQIGNGVDTDGSPFYHGAFVDLVLTW